MEKLSKLNLRFTLLLSFSKIMKYMEKEREEQNLREWESRDENKERDALIEGAITGVGRNLALENFPGIHEDDPS